MCGNGVGGCEYIIEGCVRTEPERNLCSSDFTSTREKCYDHKQNDVCGLELLLLEFVRTFCGSMDLRPVCMR